MRGRLFSLKAAAGLAVVGLAAAALAYSSVASIALVSSFAVVVLIPAFVASRAGAGVDIFEQLAFAYGGLGLSCWCLWVAGVTIGLNQASSLGAPLVTSLLFAVVGGRRHSAAGPTRSPGGEPLRVLPSQWGSVLVTSVLLTGLVAIPFLPYGWTAADGVHRMGMTDWYKHLMVTTSLQGEIRIPPANPFLTTDTTAPYYYGFHLVAASVERGASGAGSPYAILLGLTFATAAALPVVLFVLARGLFQDASLAALTAVGGSLLAGFDLVVWIFSAIRETVAHWPLARGFAGLRAIVPSSHLNFWLHHNERQLNAPYLATIWAPHHVSAVLLALLVIHVVGRRDSRHSASVVGYGLSAVMLAALPAMSAYVALAFAVAVAAVLFVDAWRLRRLPWRTRAFGWWWTIGAAAAVLSVPIVLRLSGSEGGQLVLAVSSAGSWINGAFWSFIFGDHGFTRLLDTPALYLLQFGTVGVLGLRGIVRRARRQGLTDAQRDVVTMAAAIVLLVTLVRPPVGTPNNLFARPMLLVWAFVASFAAADWLESGRSWLRAVALTISLAGTVLAVAGATAEGALFWPTSVDVVHAAQWVNDHTPIATIVATPSRQPGLGYWLWRRTVTSDRRLALLFGATPAEYDTTVGRLVEAGDAATPEAAWRRFGELGADVVLVDAPIPAWGRPPCFRAGYLSNTVSVLVREQDCPP